LTIICGYASQALADSLAFTGDDDSLGIPDMGDQTKSYVFFTEIDNMTDCETQDTCPDSAISPDIMAIIATWDNAGTLQTISVASSKSLSARRNIHNSYTGNRSKIASRNYLKQSGDAKPAATDSPDNNTKNAPSGDAGSAGAVAVEAGKNVPGDTLYEIIESPDFAADMDYISAQGGVFDMNQARVRRRSEMPAGYFVRIGVVALGADPTKVKEAIDHSLMAYDFSKPSLSIAPGTNFAVGGPSYYSAIGGTPYPTSDRNDDPMLIGARDADNTYEVKKPDMKTMAIIGAGAIAAMVLLGMIITAIAGRSAKG